MIRTATFTLLVLLATTASAQEVRVRSYEAIVVEPLPAATHYMSRGEFARWARQENQAAIADSFARDKAIKSGKPAPKERRAIVSESTGTIKRRFGGGVGYGGFGGNGGYAGYNSNDNGFSNTMYAGMYGGGSNSQYNYGYGFGNPGNASQESNTQSSISYEMVYGDFPTWDGGSVTVINPFCPPKR